MPLVQKNPMAVTHIITQGDMDTFTKNKGILIAVSPGQRAKMQVASTCHTYLLGLDDGSTHPVMDAAQASLPEELPGHLLLSVKPQHMAHIAVGKKVHVRFVA